MRQAAMVRVDRDGGRSSRPTVVRKSSVSFRYLDQREAECAAS